MKKILGLALLLSLSFQLQAAAGGSIRITPRVDWERFLGRNDIVWEWLPHHFDYGAFLGNGMLGSTIYINGSNRIRWEMGCSDVTEHRRDNARLPIGGLVLDTVGKIKGGDWRTDLWNAEVRGKVITERGSLLFRTFIHSEKMVMVIDLETTGEEKGAKFTWIAEPCVDRDTPRRYREPENPPPVRRVVGKISVSTQPRFAGGEFAAAWTEALLGEKRRVFMSVVDSFPNLSATPRAIATVQEACKADFTSLLASHRNWWHAFYPKNFVTLPDPQVESFYWIQWYKLASASRPHLRPVDLLGPWYRRTYWPRIWWNLNIETLYLPVYTGNRLELGESFVKFLDDKRANFYKNAKDYWHFDDCATVPHTTDYEGLRGNGSCAPSHYINPGDFTWALHNYYLHYRYSMDHSIVTNQTRHAFYPLLRDSINLYLKLMKRGEDGKLHLPKLMSPEYGVDEDNNYNLSLLRWGCQTLIELNERYGLKDPRAPVWQATLRDLTPYQVDKTGLRIGKNLPFSRSHRHWSHIQMVHPLHIMTGETPGERDLMRRSIIHWLTVDNSRGINGWSRAAAASLYSTLRDGENAFKQIHGHLADARFVRPNTMYIEGCPVIECSIVLNRSVQDMLLQSWGGKIAVLPAVPAAWSDLAFHDLRTEGAFLVSAVRKEGKTRWIRIKSLAGEPCRVEPLMEGKITLFQNGKHFPVTLGKQGTVDLNLTKGEEVLLYTGENLPECVIEPVPLEPKNRNFWGGKLNRRH